MLPTEFLVSCVDKGLLTADHCFAAKIIALSICVFAMGTVSGQSQAHSWKSDNRASGLRRLAQGCAGSAASIRSGGHRAHYKGNTKLLGSGRNAHGSAAPSS